MDVGRITSAVVEGAVAGDLDVAGIVVGDEIISVQVLSAGNPNLASEFTVSEDGVINNDDGTSTAGENVMVTWYKNYGGRAISPDAPIGRSSF